MPQLAFSIWLTFFGVQIAVVALSRRRRRISHLNNIVASKEDIMSQLPESKEDFISRLPDNILVSIIARKPFKEAVRTSILSKRWRNLYNLVTNINLRCDFLVPRSTNLPHDSNMIINGVNKFLIPHSKIRSLDLRCCLMNLPQDWCGQFVYSLGRLGIERLILHCSCSPYYSDLAFSCHLLSQMPSLKYFDLGHCSLNRIHSLKYSDVGLCSLTDEIPSLKLSQSNCLQVLKLTYVTIRKGALECILSNCLSLHSLLLEFCRFPSKLSFCGPNLRLKHLRFRYGSGVKEIEIHADNLLTFEFENTEVVNFIFDHVPSLQSIFFNFWDRAISRVCWKLAKDLPDLKSLIFSTQGDLNHFYQVSRTHTFSSLMQLKLHITENSNVNLLLLTRFLQSCPLLQEFHLDTEYVEFDEQEVKVNPPPVPVFHRGLKKVEITGFCGTENEIEFAFYILKCAIYLKQMLISRCPKWYRGCGRWTGLYDYPPWTKEKHEIIHKRLLGQAWSKRARVTIQHFYVYELNRPKREDDTHFGNYVFNYVT